MPPTLGDYGLATWRACFYGLMYFHWRNSEVHTPPAYDPKMFGYDQFWWVPPLMPQDPAAVDACRELGGQLALLAAAGVAFPLTSGVYTLMAARHLFASITHFTNHNYLFVLLSLLTCCSGARPPHCPPTWRGQGEGSSWPRALTPTPTLTLALARRWPHAVLRRAARAAHRWLAAVRAAGGRATVPRHDLAGGADAAAAGRGLPLCLPMEAPPRLGLGPMLPPHLPLLRRAG